MLPALCVWRKIAYIGRMRRTSWLLLAAAGLFHLAMLVGWRFQTPLVPYFFDATVLTGGRGIDFYSIYQAGYNARHGVDIYENDPARAPIVVPHFTPYRYLPPVAYTAGAALSLLPSLTAYKVWLVVVELTLLGCVALAWRSARDRRLAMLLSAMWLAFTPYYLELFMGQFSLVQAALIFGLLLMATDATRQTDAGLTALRAGALWLASVIWKINTVIFAPVFLRLRRWRTLLVSGLLLVVVSAPYFAVFPAHGLDFLRNNFGGGVSTYELGNLGFRQLVFEALADLGAPAAVQSFFQAFTIVAILCVCLGLTFPVRLVWNTAGADEARSGTYGGRRIFSFGHLTAFYPEADPPVATLLCLWLAAYFLISPQIWEDHYVMLLPALAICLRQSWGKAEAWFVWLVWLLVALPTPFGFTSLPAQIMANHDLRGFPLHPAWQPLLEHASKAIPTLLFFIYLARRPARLSSLKTT